MKSVKSATSDSYQDYLISHLRDPNYVAVYLETHLEENNLEPELLQRSLNNVCEALSPSKMNPEQAGLHCQKLNELLNQPGSQAIQDLADWLRDLGLQLTVKVPTCQ